MLRTVSTGVLALAFLSIDLPAACGSSETTPRLVAFEARDGTRLEGLLYPGGAHAVVLAHGGVFDKESWTPLAAALAGAGLTVLAFDFRGYGDGEPTYGLPGKPLDVLAAIDHLVTAGFAPISVVGASMGAGAAMAASGETDRIDKLVLLAPGSEGLGSGIRASSTLFITAETDRLRAAIDAEYAAAPEPKRIEILPGSAHAQHLYATDQAGPLTRLILDFLSEE